MNMKKAADVIQKITIATLAGTLLVQSYKNQQSHEGMWECLENLQYDLIQHLEIEVEQNHEFIDRLLEVENNLEEVQHYFPE